jgi:uncharacterized membrane protein YfcA
MNEMVQNSWQWLLLISLVGGTLSGALGVGSGILIIPALVLGLGFQQKVAQGVCLGVMVPMALTGAFSYYVNPDIKISLSVILVMIPLAMAGAYLGSQIAAWLPALILRRFFGVFIIVVGARMIFAK